MNILYVSPRYYPSIGGVEYTVQRLAEGMKAQGHSVTVACGDPSARSVKVEEINGIQVIKVPTYAPSNSFHIPKNKDTVEKILDDKADIVHTHSAHAAISMTPAGVKKALKPRWKLVYTMHFSTPGYTFFRRGLWKLFWKRHINSSLKYVDAIHSTSPLESNMITSNFSNAKGKLMLIPLGIDEDVLNYNWKGRDSNYILYCGRIEKYKRIDLVMKSIEYVRKQGYNVRFFIVGSGSQSNYFKKISKRDGSIVYMPPKPRHEYLKLLSNARAVVSLSMAENFNLFLAEACVIGIPIVASSEAVAFCPKFANIGSFNPKAIAQVIVKAISNPESCIIPRNYLPSPWKDVIKCLSTFYTQVLYS